MEDKTFCRDQGLSELQDVLAANKKWSDTMVEKNPEFFSRLATGQAPQWLWMGCSDSRVTANELVGMGQGDLFVHRNVGNIVTHKDMNAMSCMEYAITSLKVKHIIVCGHYGCGAVRAALELPCKTAGLVNLWIQDIREVRDNHAELIHSLPTADARADKLAELNVIQQVFNVCTSPVVQSAWDDGQALAVHGLIYNIADGLLKDLTQPLTSLDDFVHYCSASGHHDHLAHLSKNVMTFMSFEAPEVGSPGKGNGAKELAAV